MAQKLQNRPHDSFSQIKFDKKDPTKHTFYHAEKNFYYSILIFQQNSEIKFGGSTYKIIKLKKRTETALSYRIQKQQPDKREILIEYEFIFDHNQQNENYEYFRDETNDGVEFRHHCRIALKRNQENQDRGLQLLRFIQLNNQYQEKKIKLLDQLSNQQLQQIEYNQIFVNEINENLQIEIRKKPLVVSCFVQAPIAVSPTITYQQTFLIGFYHSLLNNSTIFNQYVNKEQNLQQYLKKSQAPLFLQQQIAGTLKYNFKLQIPRNTLLKEIKQLKDIKQEQQQQEIEENRERQIESIEDDQQPQTFSYQQKQEYDQRNLYNDFQSHTDDFNSHTFDFLSLTDDQETDILKLEEKMENHLKLYKKPSITDIFSKSLIQQHNLKMQKKIDERFRKYVNLLLKFNNFCPQIKDFLINQINIMQFLNAKANDNMIMEDKLINQALLKTLAKQKYESHNEHQGLNKNLQYLYTDNDTNNYNQNSIIDIRAKLKALQKIFNRSNLLDVHQSKEHCYKLQKIFFDKFYNTLCDLQYQSQRRSLSHEEMTYVIKAIETGKLLFQKNVLGYKFDSEESDDEQNSQRDPSEYIIINSSLENIKQRIEQGKKLENSFCITLPSMSIHLTKDSLLKSNGIQSQIQAHKSTPAEKQPKIEEYKNILKENNKITNLRHNEVYKSKEQQKEKENQEKIFSRNCKLEK